MLDAMTKNPKVRLLLARICIPCIVLGMLFIAYGSFAWAQAGAVSYAPDYAMWFNLLFGLVLALGGAYIRGMAGSIKDTKADLKELQEGLEEHKLDIARNHHTKREISDCFDKIEKSMGEKFGEIKQSNAALHRRLDHLHVPSSFHDPSQG